jgi:uncharacterized protein YcaQ
MMVDTGSAGLCRLIDPVLEFDRADHAECAAAAAAVVDPFDPVTDSERSGSLVGHKYRSWNSTFIVAQKESA